MATAGYHPGVFDKDGNPVPMSTPIIKPLQPEGMANPTPAKGAANALALIPKLPQQPGLL